DTATLEQAIENLGEFGVPIMDEISFPEEEPVERIGQLPSTLLHKGGRGVRGDAGDLDAPCGQLYDHEGLDHGVGHPALSILSYSSPRWTEGRWRYLNGCQNGGKH